MEVITTERVASVTLIVARLSEDELLVLETALNHALATLVDEEIKRQFGASRDELEGIRDDLRVAADEHYGALDGDAAAIGAGA